MQTLFETKFSITNLTDSKQFEISESASIFLSSTPQITKEKVSVINTIGAPTESLQNTGISKPIIDKTRYLSNLSETYLKNEFVYYYYYYYYLQCKFNTIDSWWDNHWRNSSRVTGQR